MLRRARLVAQTEASFWDKISHQDSFWSTSKKSVKISNLKIFKFNKGKMAHLNTSTKSSKPSRFQPSNLRNTLTDTRTQCTPSTRATTSQGTRSSPFHKCRPPVKCTKCTHMAKININNNINNKRSSSIKTSIRRSLCSTQASTSFHRRTEPACPTRSSCRASPSHRTSNRCHRLTS